MKWIALASTLMLTMPNKVYSFEVSDVQGIRINLLEQLAKDQWTLVMLWQLNCVPCERHKAAVAAFNKKYRTGYVHVIALNIDGDKYLPEINRHLQANNYGLQNLVALADVFGAQSKASTGKVFATSPGYLLYSPSKDLSLAINHVVNIHELLSYLETQFVEKD